MFAWLVAAALFEAAAVSSDSAGSRFFGGEHNGAAAAILSANGEGTMLGAASLEADVGDCKDACDTYMPGVTKASAVVCMKNDRTCAPSGCGGAMCRQRFDEKCKESCSNWADATQYSLNVCQNTGDTSMCNGKAQCNPDEWRCQQKPVEECDLYCAGFEGPEGTDTFAVSQDSELVCQNLEASATTDMGVCMPLPCSVHHHNSTRYGKTQICRQAYPPCGNSCAAGSDQHNDTTTCFDPHTEKCHNRLHCGAELTRCIPTPVHQDLSNVDLADEGSLLDDHEAPKRSPGMTQKEWRDEQQRVRIANLQRRQKRQQKESKMMRRDTEAAK